jgi:NDP-sugar pyrophosphorylase family protein
MSNFSTSYYFDLSAYKHASIFANCQHVWQALGHLEEYLKTLSLGKIEVDIPPGVFLENPELITLEKGVKVEPGAYIKGPCYIGSGSTIRQGAYIRGFFLAGTNCVIGHDTEIKNSIFLNDTHAAHFAYIGDSILGNHVNLGAGTKCANLKLDNQQIKIKTPTENVATGMRKLGAIIGDHSQTGCNTVLNPGALFGKSVWCYPLVNVSGFIPSKSVVKNNVTLSITQHSS